MASAAWLPPQFVVAAAQGQRIRLIEIRPVDRRDAAIRAQWKRAQEHLIMANTAAEEHAAELEQGPEAAIGDDPLARMEGETHGTDADAGEYLEQSDETLEAPEMTEEEAAPEAE